MNDARFIYASYRSLDQAETSLFEMFASGDVFPSEKPKIERRKTPEGIRWDITLPA